MPLSAEIRLTIFKFLAFNDLLSIRRLNRHTAALICRHAKDVRHRKCSIYLRHDSVSLDFVVYIQRNWGRPAPALPIRFAFQRSPSVSLKFSRIGSSSSANIESFAEDPMNIQWALSLPLLQLFDWTFHISLSDVHLIKVVPYLPRDLRRLYFDMPIGTKTLLETLNNFPHLSTLYLSSKTEWPIGCGFFAHATIQRLRHLSIIARKEKKDEVLCLNDELLAQQKWLSASFTSLTGVTVAGVNRLLQEWATGKREIIRFKIYFLSTGANVFERLFDQIDVRKHHQEERKHQKGWLLKRSKDPTTLSVRIWHFREHVSLEFSC